MHTQGCQGYQKTRNFVRNSKILIARSTIQSNWVKSKTICHFLRNFDEFPNGFWFYSILARWSTWQRVFLNFSQNFWSFDTHDTPGCASAVIWNHLKQIWAIPPTVYIDWLIVGFTRPNSEIICGQNVGTKVVLWDDSIFWKESYAENLKEIVGAL